MGLVLYSENVIHECHSSESNVIRMDACIITDRVKVGIIILFRHIRSTRKIASTITFSMVSLLI